MRDERFEMRVSRELLARVDAWRQQQTVPPTRAAAMRHLISRGLDEQLAASAKYYASPPKPVAV